MCEELVDMFRILAILVGSLLSLYIVGCTTKYHDDINPLINKTDLEPGQYRIVVHGYSVNEGKIEWIETYPSAKEVPGCRRILELGGKIYCASHKIRIMINPQPLNYTGNRKHLPSDVRVLRLGSIEMLVQITKTLGTRVQRIDRLTDVTIHEYEGIPIKNLRSTNMLFEFE